MLTPGMNSAARISNSASVNIQAQFDKVANKGKSMGASVNELRKRLEAVNQVRFSTQYAKEFETATKAAKKLELQIEKLEHKGNSKIGGGSMLGSFVKGNLIAGGLQSLLSSSVNTAGEAWNDSKTKRSTLTALDATTGGKGALAMQQTAAIAEKYGLNLKASYDGVKTLTGGLMSMNMPLEKQMKIFEGVSTGIAAMGLSAEQQSGALLALGQMASKGTVSAEELRGQLGERIPGAFGLAAKAMNVTEAELNKMLQRGEIASKDFLPAFAEQMQKTFGIKALEAANGPTAVQNRFENALFNIRTTLGEGLMPVILPFLEKMTELANTAIPYIQSGLQFIIGLFSGINTSSETWQYWMDWIKNLLSIAWNYISTIFVKIWNIISGVIQWAAKSELIKDIFWGISKLGEGVLFLVNKVADAIGWIWKNVIKPSLDAIEWVYNKVKQLLGLNDGKAIEIKGTVDGKTISATVPGASELTKFNNVVDPTLLNNSITNAAANANNQSAINSSKASNINSGGQRPITIHIGKQIETINQHIIGGTQQVADDLELAIKEAMRRVFQNLNSLPTN